MIRKLDNQDRDLCMAYIRSHEMDTTFLHGNVLDIGVENRPEIRRSGDYFGWFEPDVEKPDELCLHGILPFYNLGSCIPHYDSNKAISPFLELMRERHFDVLLGMSSIIEPLYEGLKDVKIVKERDDSWYMTNPEPVSQINAELTFRLGNWEDVGMVRFIADCSRICLGNDTDEEKQREAMRQNEGGAGWLLAETGGRFVSMACLQTYTDTLYQIGGVATPEPERGKGYCKATVYELCQRIRSVGKIPSLFVIKENTPAVRAYEHIGFVKRADYLMMKFTNPA